MLIQIIAVGKIKEKFLKMAVDEYSKRLTAYCRLDIIEIKDSPIPEKASQADKLKILEQEGLKILSRIKDSATLICLDIDGEISDSLNFSKKIENLTIRGKSHLVFIIGGSLGLSMAVKKRAHWRLSFSPMTFPHQLFRIMLLEQLYRSFKIIYHETYHK